MSSDATRFLHSDYVIKDAEDAVRDLNGKSFLGSRYVHIKLLLV
jgi:hypothetical protein